MRKIAEIQKDLAAKVEAVRSMDQTDKAAFRAAMDEVNALRQELNDARDLEAAERAAAEEQFRGEEKKEGRRFSIVKFLREAAEGNLTGLEKKAAEMGAAEYERMGLSKKGFVIPMALLRSSAGQNATTDADGGYANAPDTAYGKKSATLHGSVRTLPLLLRYSQQTRQPFSSAGIFLSCMLLYMPFSTFRPGKAVAISLSSKR